MGVAISSSREQSANLNKLKIPILFWIIMTLQTSHSIMSLLYGLNLFIELLTFNLILSISSLFACPLKLFFNYVSTLVALRKSPS